MVIFHSYVSLPEGTIYESTFQHGTVLFHREHGTAAVTGVTGVTGTPSAGAGAGSGCVATRRASERDSQFMADDNPPICVYIYTHICIYIGLSWLLELRQQLRTRGVGVGWGGVGC